MRKKPLKETYKEPDPCHTCETYRKRPTLKKRGSQKRPIEETYKRKSKSTQPAWRAFYLQHTATKCNALQHTATHFLHATQHSVAQAATCHVHFTCSILQQSATHCNKVQRTATHCNTLQHTATHCNTLQHTLYKQHNPLCGRLQRVTCISPYVGQDSHDAPICGTWHDASICETWLIH